MVLDCGIFGWMGFIMVVVGLVIGFGNIWKFLYIIYVNDGGFFVFVYFVVIFFIGVLIMFVEVVFGRCIE